MVVFRRAGAGLERCYLPLSRVCGRFSWLEKSHPGDCEASPYVWLPRSGELLAGGPLIRPVDSLINTSNSNHPIRVDTKWDCALIWLAGGTPTTSTGKGRNREGEN
jgi:hypothetical protein